MSCGFSSIGTNLYLYGTSCLLNCPNGYFANSTANTCDICATGCAICSGPTLNDCSVCLTVNNSGTLTPYYKEMGVTTCNTSCPSGQLISSYVVNSCSMCDPGCISCSITSANCTITACQSGYYYYYINSTCLSTCPNNYYANTTTGLCVQCDPGCQLCTGSGLLSCSSCQITSLNVSYFKVIDITQCTTVCPPGQYPYNLLLQCQYCASSCLTCNTSAIDCQTCNNISGVPYFNLNNKCLLTCPGGYYGQ